MITADEIERLTQRVTTEIDAQRLAESIEAGLPKAPPDAEPEIISESVSIFPMAGFPLPLICIPGILDCRFRPLKLTRVKLDLWPPWDPKLYGRYRARTENTGLLDLKSCSLRAFPECAGKKFLDKTESLGALGSRTFGAPGRVSNPVTLYDKRNYGGRSARLSGNCPDLGDVKMRNDADSIKVAAGYVITLFDHRDYRGDSIAVCKDVPDLDKEPWKFADKASSLKIGYEPNAYSSEFSWQVKGWDIIKAIWDLMVHDYVRIRAKSTVKALGFSKSFDINARVPKG